jgi:hypothetical protein
MTEFSITYSDLCELLFDCGCAVEEGLHTKYPQLSGEQVTQVSEEIRVRFLSNFNMRKREVYHSKDKFWQRYREWLTGKLNIIVVKLMLIIVYLLQVNSTGNVSYFL